MRRLQTTMIPLRWSIQAVTILLLTILSSYASERVIEGDVSHYELNDSLQYLVDDGELSLADALQSDGWHQNTSGRVLNLGFTAQTLWARTSLNITTATGHWYIAIPYPLLEEVELFVLPQGQLPATYITSRTETEKQQHQPHSYQLALPLPRELHGEVDIVLRARSATSLQLPVELWREDPLLNQFAQESIYWGIYFGILGALVIYNLFLCFSLRDRAYGYYVLYIGSIGLLTLCISGVGSAWLWAGEPLVPRYLIPVSTSLVSICALLFARSFLELQKISRNWDLAMKTALGLAVSLFFITWIDPIHGALLSGVLGTFVIALLIAVGIADLRAGLVIARYFVLAWTSFAIGTSLYLLSIFNLLPVNFFTNHLMQVGSAAEVLLLSFALAHKIKDERARKLAAMRKQQIAERQVQDLEMQSLEQAMHDSVTKMPNTSLLNQRLQSLITKRQRFALVLVHYPQVKEIASSMGHSLAEDMFCQLVKKVNHTLSGLTGPVCLEHRLPAYLATPDLGSAAFVVDLDNFVGPLESFIEQVVGYHEVSLHSVRFPVFMNLYCGVSIAPDHGDTTEILYQHAAAARDRSQSNQIPVQVYNESISGFARRRLELLTALPGAIDANELELYLQPQMEKSGQSLVGAELLLRWNSPRFGMVPTEEVINIAENAGLIDILSRYVVDLAWKTMESLRERQLNITCSINLSVQNLTNSQFVPYALAGIKEYGIPMDKVIFEVTETSMMHNMEAVIGSLLHIADSGCKVALDDFGTGYSSLAYLSRLPIHELKIDRCFISRMNTNRNELGIVKTTLKLAQTLHLEAVAEGVEDQATLDLLNELGCQRVQGYLFAKPMPFEEFCIWAEQV
ncbi:EAL domain-containing protein [Marinobacter salinexigens]|uniref:EAL domain-containing protein n=1 Tax=Marinobacter salinexigens TaxID=2919747 RepID=A0A5B0VPK2_9GAMM|nr:EAL domain-containing protein [Marinobacter salinexigens]KAA1176125.1 EAL domain-containing protein [Marinobacter salinexigens]